MFTQLVILGVVVALVVVWLCLPRGRTALLFCLRRPTLLVPALCLWLVVLALAEAHAKSLSAKWFELKLPGVVLMVTTSLVIRLLCHVLVSGWTLWRLARTMYPEAPASFFRTTVSVGLTLAFVWAAMYLSIVVATLIGVTGVWVFMLVVLPVMAFFWLARGGRPASCRALARGALRQIGRDATPSADRAGSTRLCRVHRGHMADRL